MSTVYFSHFLILSDESDEINPNFRKIYINIEVSSQYSGWIFFNFSPPSTRMHLTQVASSFFNAWWWLLESLICPGSAIVKPQRVWKNTLLPMNCFSLSVTAVICSIGSGTDSPQMYPSGLLRGIDGKGKETIDALINWLRRPLRIFLSFVVKQHDDKCDHRGKDSKQYKWYCNNQKQYFKKCHHYIFPDAFRKSITSWSMANNAASVSAILSVCLAIWIWACMIPSSWFDDGFCTVTEILLESSLYLSMLPFI